MYAFTVVRACVYVYDCVLISSVWPETLKQFICIIYKYLIYSNILCEQRMIYTHCFNNIYSILACILV